MTTDMNEAPKAIAEVAKASGKAIDAGRAAGGWLDKIFGGLIEDAVALQWSDRMKARRIAAAIYDWERLETLAHEADLRLKERGIHTTRTIPPKIAIPLLEQATMEDDNELHKLWANLLTNGLDPSAAEIEKKYISVLSELTSADAIVFASIIGDWAEVDKSKLTNDSTLKYGPSVDGAGCYDKVSIITLNRLGLISPAFTEFQTYEPPGYDERYGDYSETRDPVRVYGDLEFVMVTPFGEAFSKAITM